MTEVIHIFFLILAAFGTLLIVATKNIVHAAYALCLTLVAVAGIYVLQGSELIAVVQIMLYAGGVVILLAFGVMMTNRLRGEKVITGSKGVVTGAAISIAVFVGLVLTFSQVQLGPEHVEVIDKNQIEAIGISFLTDNLVAFELIAFILLVALVGASYLAKAASDE